ncbi:unnamed protein product [Protopolystoma xenopodis]|uniref:Uncharacterized protein n=1 Tax=Protopolystoma xenopodis TaxID=117903 RepID=A0A3S5B5Y1_9PLAT|nr:unnamed protein product [Protopolystoma xenopodis]
MRTLCKNRGNSANSPTPPSTALEASHAQPPTLHLPYASTPSPNRCYQLPGQVLHGLSSSHRHYTSTVAISELAASAAASLHVHLPQPRLSSSCGSIEGVQGEAMNE